MKNFQKRTKPHKISNIPPPHTRQDSATLQTGKITPRKELGQNFLRDANIARNIVRSIEASSDDVLIEIGPGEGALTGLLLQSEAQAVIAVEYDPRAVDILQTKFAHELARKRLFIVHQDILHSNISSLLALLPSPPSNLKIVGNIPYYITSDILFWIFEEWAELIIQEQMAAPERAIIMMQKEVAERITAKVQTKEYGILSVASALVSFPKILFHVSPSCFFPPPNVSSSVVEFRMKSDQTAALNFKPTHTLVRAAFNQRRKILSNALHTTLQRYTKNRTDTTPQLIIALAEERGLSYFRKRAEELSCDDFLRLADFLRTV